MGCAASSPRVAESETLPFKSRSKKELGPIASNDKLANQSNGIVAVANSQSKMAVHDFDPSGQGDSPNSYHIRAEGMILSYETKSRVLSMILSVLLKLTLRMSGPNWQISCNNSPALIYSPWRTSLTSFSIHDLSDTER